MTGFKTLDDLDAAGKRVLVRVDLNVPVVDGQITDFTRIDAIKPTITELVDQGAKVVLLAHFGRPKGQVVPEMSLKPIAPAVSDRIGRPVAFAADCVGEPASQAIETMTDGDILLLENTRFHAGEEKDDAALADQMATLGDAYVNDAFSAAHRAHVTTHGLARRLPAYAGRLMERELSALNAALGKPERPVVAIVGGAKVSTKIDLLENLVTKVDALVIGGGMANTFLAARGIDVGKSLCEHDLAETAKRIEEAAEKNGCAIVLPEDAVAAKEFAVNAEAVTDLVSQVPADHMILDAGPASIDAINTWIAQAKTLVWNGPLGAFEIEPFDRATVACARFAAECTKTGKLMSVAGGGDTVAALAHARVAGDFSYISTAGGAFLEWLEGKTLPGVAALDA